MPTCSRLSLLVMLLKSFPCSADYAGANLKNLQASDAAACCAECQKVNSGSSSAAKGCGGWCVALKACMRCMQARATVMHWRRPSAGPLSPLAQTGLASPVSFHPQDLPPRQHQPVHSQHLLPQTGRRRLDSHAQGGVHLRRGAERQCSGHILLSRIPRVKQPSSFHALQHRHNHQHHHHPDDLQHRHQQLRLLPADLHRHRDLRREQLQRQQQLQRRPSLQRGERGCCCGGLHGWHSSRI